MPSICGDYDERHDSFAGTGCGRGESGMRAILAVLGRWRAPRREREAKYFTSCAPEHLHPKVMVYTSNGCSN